MNVFSGIIEEVGTVQRVVRVRNGKDLTIRARRILSGLSKGASVSVGGACLTVLRKGKTSFEVHAVRETLDRSVFQDLARGSRVNLERSIRPTDRLDGHIVQGHVDGIGTVSRSKNEGSSVRLWIRAPREVRRYVVEKGSITVDGVSLTVAEVKGKKFAVALIPHTMRVTTLGSLKKGSRVNLETDVVARYVEQLLSGRRKDGRRKSAKKKGAKAGKRARSRKGAQAAKTPKKIPGTAVRPHPPLGPTGGGTP